MASLISSDVEETESEWSTDDEESQCSLDTRRNRFVMWSDDTDEENEIPQMEGLELEQVFPCLLFPIYYFNEDFRILNLFFSML